MGSNPSVMENDVFALTNFDRCLGGTAEIVLNSLHSNEIFGENQLPIKYAGFSECFRKEAGAAGRDTRGIMRIHEFHKVEQYVYCTPEQSDEMHEHLLNNLCEIMADLELPYRVLECCTGDMGFNKVKMNDVEAWVPQRGSLSRTGQLLVHWSIPSAQNKYALSRKCHERCQILRNIKQYWNCSAPCYRTSY